MVKFDPHYLAQCLQADFGISEARPITSDMSITDARKSSLLSSVLKKLEPEDPSILDAKAISLFLESNSHCKAFTWVEDDYCEQVLNIARERMHSTFYSREYQSSTFGLADFCDEGRTGPGSSIGTKRTDFYGKMFKSTLTMTDVSLYKFYTDCLSPKWKTADHQRSKLHGEVVVSGSKLSTVPKNCEINRTICTEPSLNMFFQLGAGVLIEGILKTSHNIDLSKQPDINKALARIGSVTGEYATIDLKSASDTISTTLVKRLLPRHLYAMLDLIRSKSVSIGSEVIELSMFSSMGNGFTFPLQTWIFAELVHAAYEFMGIPPVNKGLDRNYAVFGDDIICSSAAYSFVCRVLQHCGFFVNSSKSFNVGMFRESCGGDFFKGYDIRGVYLKKNRGQHDIYSAFNRLARWSAKYGIDLTCTLLYLRKLAVFRPIPFDEGDSCGYKIPERWLESRKRDRNGAIHYSLLVSVPQVLKVPEDAVGENPDGLEIAFVGGYIRNNQIGVRINKPKWKVKRRKTPSWDFVPLAGLTSRDFEYALIGVFESLSAL